jgi:hypothetical protein
MTHVCEVSCIYRHFNGARCPKENIWTRNEVTGEWRKLHNEELHILYAYTNTIKQIKSRRLRWAGHVARMGEERKVYKVSVGKPEGKSPLGRPRRIWDGGVRMYLREIGGESVD